MHLFGSGRQEQIGFAAGGRGLSTPTEPNVAYDIYPALPMKVAVVGSGVSGLAATWLLNEYSDHEVHLYEADSRAGGHANTVSFTAPGVQNAQAVDVDTGFLVFNPVTYPNFMRFLHLYPDLVAAIQPTAMTFSVSRDGGAFEWAGKSLSSVFCQPMRVFDRNMWRMLYDILRFNACAQQILRDEAKANVSVGEYLQNEGYSAAFKDNYLLPMVAAIWSTPPDKCALDFPVRTLIRFMNNHHLLQITGKPAWLTFCGGSRLYVDKIISSLPSRCLHLNSPVRAITTFPTTAPFLGVSKATHEVHLQLASGETEVFDHVILACHADTALEILRWGGPGGGLSYDEERILGMFRFNRNEAVLHSDVRLMPKRRAAWSCWNYIMSSETAEKIGKTPEDTKHFALTYYLPVLQHLPDVHGPVLLTLNPPVEPAPGKVVARFQYDHPVIDSQAIHAQALVPSIQNVRGITYAGAWLKYGFHEDGLTSGLRAALALQAHTPKGSAIRCPFEVRDAEYEPRSNVFLVFLFEVVERTGLRALLGFVLGLLLDILSSLLLALVRSSLRVLDCAV